MAAVRTAVAVAILTVEEAPEADPRTVFRALIAAAVPFTAAGARVSAEDLRATA